MLRQLAHPKQFFNRNIIRKNIIIKNNKIACAIFSRTTTSTTSTKQPAAGEKFVESIGWHPKQLVVPSEKTNRFKFVPAALANHVCLGGIFAWSVFNKPLTSMYGVVAPAGSDWLLAEATPVFSLVMGGFIWGAIFGKYLDAWGPRVSCLIGAAGLGGGYCIVAAGAAIHSLPIIYLGGLTWGLCNGWAYTPPVATLLKWFPDRKGLASGMCIAGYGGGGALGTYLGTQLQQYFRKAPEYLGPSDSIQYENVGGQLFVKNGEEMREIVIATAADVSTWVDEGLLEGVYAVGTGSTGLIETFACMGALYAPIMVISSFVYKLPPAGYAPEGAKSSATNIEKEEEQQQKQSSSEVTLTEHNVDAEVATRTKQFGLLYLGFGCVATGAYGFIGAGKTLIYDGFASNLPEIVTPAFATAFVGAIGIANLSGRLVWPALSDKLAEWKGGDPFYGRRLAFSLMWGICPAMYLGVVWAVHECAVNPSALPLAVFYGSVLGIISSFGGAAAGRPALIGDLYGLKNVGNLAARQLSVVMPAAFLGPYIVATMRESASIDAIKELCLNIDDSAFTNAFAAGKDQLDTLIEQKTVTISRLMEIAPPGTIDPTPFLYDNCLILLAGIQTTALLTNWALTPVDPALHEKEEGENNNNNKED